MPIHRATALGRFEPCSWRRIRVIEIVNNPKTRSLTGLAALVRAQMDKVQ